MTSAICRNDGAIVAFNTMRNDEETPKIWIRLIRERSQDVPIVVCGVTGLNEFDQEPDAQVEEKYRAVCAAAGVDYFGVDMRVNDGRLERMLEVLIEKANVWNSARK